MQGLKLAGGRLGLLERQQRGRVEGFGVQVMRVQRRHQRRPLLNQPHPRVCMAVNPTLVPFGQPEPALQIQIVLRQVDRTDEQPRRPGRHPFGHALVNRFLFPGQAFLQRLELPGAPPAILLQCRRHCPQDGAMTSYLRQLRLDLLQSAVDAPGQTLQVLLRRPPFLASRFRWSEARTRVRLWAIASPGGCSGPP